MTPKLEEDTKKTDYEEKNETESDNKIKQELQNSGVKKHIFNYLQKNARTLNWLCDKWKAKEKTKLDIVKKIINGEVKNNKNNDYYEFKYALPDEIINSIMFDIISTSK